MYDQSNILCTDTNEERRMAVDTNEGRHPHTTDFVSEILNRIGLDLMSDEFVNNNRNNVSLLTKHDLSQMAKDDQIHIATSLNELDNEELGDELDTITGWSGLVPGPKVTQKMVFAANWAQERGGMIRESCIDYEQWHEIWQTLCEQRGAISQLILTEELEDIKLWSWLNDKIYIHSKKEINIGGNSGSRCWFLSVLYFLLCEDQFMSVLQARRGATYGHRLLFKMLQSLKIGIVTQNLNALHMITQFIEAFLQGHFCYWQYFAGISTAFDIVWRMAPDLVNDFLVKYEMWSICPTHNKIQQRNVTAPRLFFKHQIDWDEETGHVMCHTQKTRQCWILGNPIPTLCNTKSKDRFVRVSSPIQQSFMIYFEHGLPAILWQHIMNGLNIYFGDDLRQIGGAIFQINPNHFVAAYLMMNPSETATKIKIWYKMETLESKITKFVHAKREDCRIIFVHPPERSCFCEQYDTSDMIQCPVCNHWIHKDCTEMTSSSQVWDGSNCGNCSLMAVE